MEYRLLWENKTTGLATPFGDRPMRDPQAVFNAARVLRPIDKTVKLRVEAYEDGKLEYVSYPHAGNKS